MNFPRSGLLRLIPCVAALSGLPSSFISTSLAQAAEADVHVMEAVLVETSAGTPWQFVSAPGVEILSRCPEPFTANYARAVVDATRARLALLPSEFWGKLASPIKIILYNQEPKQGGVFQAKRPIDLSWSSEYDGRLGSKSIQLSHPVMVGDGDAFINCGNYWNLRSAGADLSVDPDSELLLRNRVPPFPAWFLAGMEGPFGLYSNRLIETSAQGDSLVFPNATWLSASETIALQKLAQKKLKKRQIESLPALLPLGQLFTHPLTAEEKATWNAEAALFIRWALFHKETDGRDHRAGFFKFLEQCTREPVTEAVFQSCFGSDYAGVQQQLREYLPVAVTESIRIPLPSSEKTDVQVREATSTETARIIGLWARLQARALGPTQTEFKQECLERAEKLFRREVAKDNQDPRFRAEYGLYAAQEGDETPAREALEAAAAAGVLRPRVYTELARLRLKAALGYPTQGFGDLKETEFAEIIGLLSIARQQMPALLTTYHLLIQVLEHAPTKPSRENLVVLREAVKLFPANAQLAYRVATLYQRCGYGEEAQAIVSSARSFADSDEARSLLSRFPAK